jgi:hypothetical protein
MKHTGNYYYTAGLHFPSVATALSPQTKTKTKTKTKTNKHSQNLST